MKKELSEQKDIFEDEIEVILSIIEGFDLNGVKALIVLEKSGKTIHFNSGLTGKTIVNLILSLSEFHETFFYHALGLIEKMQNDQIKIKQGAKVH